MKIKTVVGAAVIAASGIMMTFPAYAVTCPSHSIRSSANTLAECNVTQDTSLMPTINAIINAIISVLGIVAVAVIVLGGVTYTTSAGDPGKIKKAKDMILYGIVGLIVALLAFAIVNFVLSSIFGSSSTTTTTT